MDKTYYATPQMIIDFNNNYYSSHKIYLTFPEALDEMNRLGLLPDAPLPFPEINATMNRKDFVSAYNSIPFIANYFFAGKLKITNEQIGEDAIFPKDKDVFCIRHEHNIGPFHLYNNTYFAIGYVYEGRCVLAYSEGEKLLETGDICIVPPGFNHCFKPLARSFVIGIIVRSSSFGLVFNDILTLNNSISSLLRSSLIYNAKNSFAVIKTNTHDDELRFYLQAFARECYIKNDYDNSCAISLFKLFLAHAYRHYQDTLFLSGHSKKSDKTNILLITNYIKSNYKSISLKETAEYFHYNESYLSRLIHNTYGKTFIQIINEMKIGHAKELLENTDMSISEIAVLSGFESKDHFSRTFRKFYGQVPSEYRIVFQNNTQTE